MARAFGWSAIVALAGFGAYSTIGHYLLAGNPHGVLRGLPALLAAVVALIYLRSTRRSPAEAMARAIGIAASVLLFGYGLILVVLTPLVSGSAPGSITGILTGLLLFAVAAPLVAHLLRSRSVVPAQESEAAHFAADTAER